MTDQLCANCEAQADKQHEQMKPRAVRAGVVRVVKRDAFEQTLGPLPDIRIGDIVRVELVAAAVEDMGFCDNEDCANWAAA